MESWDPVRSFLVAARARSFVVAARELGVSQSTVSRHVAALEAEVGARLFVRVGRRAELSDAGRALLGPAGEVRDAVARFSRIAEGATAATGGLVRVATVPELATSLLAPALPSLYAAHPAIRLTIVGHVTTASLDRREADVALRFAVPKEADLVRRKVATIGYHVAASARLATAKSIDEGPWLGHAPELAHLPEAKWVARNVPDERVIFRATSHETLAVACKKGLGFAVLPTPAARDAGLALVREAGIARALYVVAHADVLASPRVRAVFGWLEDVVTQAARARKGALAR